MPLFKALGCLISTLGIIGCYVLVESLEHMMLWEVINLGLLSILSIVFGGMLYKSERVF